MEPPDPTKTTIQSNHTQDPTTKQTHVNVVQKVMSETHKSNLSQHKQQRGIKEAKNPNFITKETLDLTLRRNKTPGFPKP